MPAAQRSTKAELRRARAEAARQAAARAQRRSRNLRIGLWSAGVVIVVVVIAVVIALTRSHGQAPTASVPTGAASGSTPAPSAAGRTGNPPWGAPADASAAVAAAGLPMLGEEGSALHIHAHLDVIVDGAPVQVPAEVGIDEARQKISPLHTHDTTGVIHIESPDAKATFTLGQFFTEWQVSMSASHIGGLTADASHHLKAYVNGKLQDGDPAGIVLRAHDEIALVYGSDSQQVNVPSSYQWTNGL
jgi:hypothetical protein